MADTNHDYPYKILGARLRGMRERLRESVAEVSGAVEIELDALTDFEQGKARPTEDILLLLISHFAVKEDEATKIWQLAGYEKDNSTTSMSTDDLNGLKNAVMVMPLDARISYTDMAHVVVNQHGVVLNFMQTAGPNNQPLVISRLGMSREHAQSLVELLQKTLAGTEPRPQQALPAPEIRQESNDNQPHDQ